MLLNELLGGITDKIKQDIEFGKTYAANVVDQQISRKKDTVDNGAPLDINKTKIAVQNRLGGKELTADDLGIFKQLSGNKDQSISAAATNTLRKLPLNSQDQRVLQDYLRSL